MPQVGKEMPFCKRWTPDELLPKASLLAKTLMDCPKVTGVALTGSLARFEKLSHDIDLIVLHNNTMTDGSCEDPPRTIVRYSNPDLDLGFTIGNYNAEKLSEIRGDVPVNYIFVNEKALWDCQYLQSLEKLEGLPGFYIAVFCQIPLLLFFNAYQKGGLAQYVRDLPPVTLEARLSNPTAAYRGFYVKHRCGDPGCKPKMSWPEREKIIKARKGHTWHDSSPHKNKGSIPDISGVKLRPFQSGY